ncbi:MAG: BMP family ABC transporter substrate-binding protein [Oligoflexia bacterium]|nr:BMP family ABC transporter substrate-binding protein [Oligoflexia bacterium]
MGRLLLAVFVGLFLGCTKKESGPSVSSDAKVKVGLVLDKGGKDDKSFNAAAFKGASDAAKDFDIELKVVESPDDASYEPAIRGLAERGFQLVITVGFAQSDALKKISPQFPKTHFAIVDAMVDVPNVASLLFSEHEGSYLVGYIAGSKTETGTVGFIGGMDVDLIKRFELGYREGVLKANPKAKILTNYVGVSSEAWMNPTKGRELTLSQIGRGADIIFSAAGATNSGVFDAVEEKKKFAIGVDSNQNWVKPGRVLTSMMKRVDLAVYNTIKAEKEGKFVWGNKFFGIADKGVDYALDEHNAALISDELKKKVEQVRTDILSGKIKVSDYYVTRTLCPKSPLNCDRSQRRSGESGRTTQSVSQ